jgi:hypothetical protein
MRILTVLAFLAFVSGAAAETFWREYDASCGLFPEECGWGRLVMGDGEQRSLEDGRLTLDSSASPGIIDSYGISHAVDLGPGELFVLEWRLRVNEVDGLADRPIKPSVSVGFDGYGMAVLSYSEGSLYSLFEHTWIDFDSYVFHDYSLTTSDLVTYTLKIDGSVACSAQFATPCLTTTMDWGDEVTGATSLSDWGYVRFGVVPEPSGALLIASACLAGVVLRARRTRRNNR